MSLYRINVMLLLLLVSLQQPSFAQDKIPQCEQAYTLCVLMSDIHYKPLKVNNILSQRTYQNFLEQLDPYKAYLRPSDFKLLEKYKRQIDDLILQNSCEFTELVAKIFAIRLAEVDSLTNKILDEGFQYDQKESITLYYNPQEQPMVVDREDYWRKALKHNVIYTLYSDHRDSTDQLDIVTVLKHEAEAREIVRARRKCILEQKGGADGNLEARLHEFFLNAVASSFDPHSLYFTPEDNDFFQAEMSTEALSFGIEFDENRQRELEVAYLWPGGSAWKTNLIKKGDVVKEIRFDKRPPINLICVDPFELMLQLSSSSVKQMEITFKKKNGVLYSTKIAKTKQKVGYNRTKSFLLEGENKIAYLSIPSFYTAEEKSSPNGVANDLAKEILQLKKEGMEGLIIDLRNNTGGSLDETMEIAGSFIDKGLLLIQEYSDGAPELIADQNRGTLYDGPIVLLVNGNSSSAAEILPATLQCYNRAVVVGSTTHGKSSSQIVLPLDLRILYDPEADFSKSANGFLKVTISKLYSVDGKTHQADGLVPDIQLPDHYNLYYMREGKLNYPLSSEPLLQPYTYKPYPKLDKNALVLRSEERLLKSEKFNFLNTYIDSLSKGNVKQAIIPLKLDDFWKYTNDYRHLFDDFDHHFYIENKAFNINNHAIDLDLIKQDPIEMELNDGWIKEIKTDAYIEESYFIVRDMIKGLF